LLSRGRQPERAYLVLRKHAKQVHVSTDDVDIEQQLEGLMSDSWVPLGFVAYYGEGSPVVTSLLNWYSDLMARDQRRYTQLF
jgi:hypothetical protein